jgi:integrase
MLHENNEHVAKAMTDAEIEKLLPELPAETRPIFEFCLATGLRIGNVLNLTWQQIDRQAKTISIPKTKSGKPLVIPLNDWAADVIKDVIRHVRSPYVFCKLNGKHYKVIHHGFKAACVRAGIGKYRIHDLRHTAATRLAASGVSTTGLKDLLGHSTLAMVQRYSHMGQQALQEMSNKNIRPFGNLSNQ